MRRQRRHSMPRPEGFTLLEVLVALAVLAFAMAALIKTGAGSAGATAYLRDKTLAQWVAMNVIAEQRLEASWPSTGTKRGREEMAQHEWYWELKVEETFDEDVRRLTVTVRASDDKDQAPVVSLVAFQPRPSLATKAKAQGAGS